MQALVKRVAEVWKFLVLQLMQPEEWHLVVYLSTLASTTLQEAYAG